MRPQPGCAAPDSPSSCEWSTFFRAACTVRKWNRTHREQGKPRKCGSLPWQPTQCTFLAITEPYGTQMSVSAFGGRRRTGGWQEARRCALGPRTNEVPSQAIAFLGPPLPKSTGSVLIPASASASVKRGAVMGGAWIDTRFCVASGPQCAPLRTAARARVGKGARGGAGRRGHAERHHMLGGDRGR